MSHGAQIATASLLIGLCSASSADQPNINVTVGQVTARASGNGASASVSIGRTSPATTPPDIHDINPNHQQSLSSAAVIATTQTGTASASVTIGSATKPSDSSSVTVQFERIEAQAGEAPGTSRILITPNR